MSPVDAPSDFDSLVRDYYGAWFRFHPEAAVDAGVIGYADRLTPFDPEARGALVCLNNEFIVALEEWPAERLSPDQRVDRDVLYEAARLENEFLLDIDPHRPDPSRYLPINAIYQLLVRPVENFTFNALQRLSAIPHHLRGAQALLAAHAHAIPSLWLKAGLTAARTGVDFLHGLKQHPRIAPADAKEFGAACDAAANALRDYADFLERDVGPNAQGDFACGREYFDHLLQRRHGLDIDAETLRAFGESLFERTLAELKAECKALSGSEDVAALTRRIQADHPAAEELLDFYRQQMDAAHQFVAARDLVSLPAQTTLDIVDTPVFLRHQIPFAAYYPPSPQDLRQRGYYYVTPPGAPEHLGEHNRAGVMHTCAHEAWPGHHLQFVTANVCTAGARLARYLNPSATLYEGWALYCEELMWEEGFLNRPEQRFLLLKDRLWRALRVMIDVDIHTAGLSVEAAADRMVRYLQFPRAMAYADLTWYSRAPTVPMGYAAGWALIRAARERLRSHEPGFTLRAFHDRLLSQGSIALPRVIRREFGEGLWISIHHQVFKAHRES